MKINSQSMQPNQRQETEKLIQNSANYKIGHTTFSTNCQTIITQVKEQVIRDTKWKINLELSWPQILTKVMSTECAELQMKIQRELTPCVNPPILIMIAEIHFSKLIRLFLIDLKITSVEGLAYLDMENLEVLVLRRNCIINMKPLSKQKWNNLDQLVLQGNKMIQIEMHRIKTNSNKIYFFNFDYGSHKSLALDGNKIGIQDLKSLVKIESPSIKYVKFSTTDLKIKEPFLLANQNQNFMGVVVAMVDKGLGLGLQ